MDLIPHEVTRTGQCEIGGAQNQGYIHDDRETNGRKYLSAYSCNLLE